MNYSNNPLQALMQMGQSMQNMPQNPMSQLMQMGKQSSPTMPQMAQTPYQPINHDQFIQSTSKLDKHALAGLVNQARSQGIPEADIEKGLDFLLKLR